MAGNQNKVQMKDIDKSFPEIAEKTERAHLEQSHDELIVAAYKLRHQVQALEYAGMVVEEMRGDLLYRVSLAEGQCRILRMENGTLRGQNSLLEQRSKQQLMTTGNLRFLLAELRNLLANGRQATVEELDEACSLAGSGMTINSGFFPPLPQPPPGWVEIALQGSSPTKAVPATGRKKNITAAVKKPQTRKKAK